MEHNPYSSPAANLTEATPVVDVPEKTLKHIKNAVIAACISGTITLIVTLAAISGTSLMGFSAWNFLDVFLIFGLAFGIYKKSRTCAILLFAYFLISKILIISETGKLDGAIFSIIFFYYYLYGIIGCFAYHKHIKEMKS